MIKNKGKKLPPLSDRLRAIVSMIDPCRCAADIGCDHGYVSVYLCAMGICERCIASDVHPGPAKRAEANAGLYGVSDRIDVRVGYGLETIEPGEASCIVLSGMGGELILSILGDGIEKAREADELILGPQSDLHKVRETLCAEGFAFADEKMIEEDGKFYPIIKIRYVGKGLSLTEAEALYGPVLIRKKDPVLCRYLKKRLTLLESISAEIPASESERTSRRYTELKTECGIIRKVLENYE